MKNLSYSADYGKIKEEIVIEKEVIVDDRVIISTQTNEVWYFLASDGKPLVFKNQTKAEKYIKKNNIEDYEIDPFQDFDFTGIEIIEL